MNQRLVTGLAVTAAALGSNSAEALAQPSAAETSPRIVTHSPRAEAGVSDFNTPLALVGELGEIAAGVVVLSGTAARARRGWTIKREYKTADGEASTASETLSALEVDTEQRLHGLPEGEPARPNLQASGQALGKASLGLAKSREKTSEVYHAQARRFWPDKRTVKKATGNTRARVAGSVEATINSGAQALNGVEESNRAVMQDVDAVGDTVLDLYVQADGLKDSGWELGGLDKKLGKLNEAAGKARDLLGANHIQKPAELVADIAERVEDLSQTLAGLPERRQTADETIERQPAAIAAAQAMINDTKARLAAIQTACDLSDYEDFKNFARNLDGHLTDLQARHQTAATVAGVKSASAVNKSERLAAQFDETQQAIVEAAETVQARQTILSTIQAELPEVMAGLGSKLQATREYAFGKHADDIEDATKSAIADLEAELKAFTDRELTADKPAYLRIKAATEEYETKITDLKAQAKAEKDEMRSLRGSMPSSYLGDIEHVKENLRSLRAQHGSIITRAVGWAFSVKAPELDMGLDREGLRAQAAAAKDLHDRMWNAFREANQAIYRERDRLREIEVAHQRRLAEIDLGIGIPPLYRRR